MFFVYDMGSAGRTAEFNRYSNHSFFFTRNQYERFVISRIDLGITPYEGPILKEVILDLFMHPKHWFCFLDPHGTMNSRNAESFVDLLRRSL